MPCADCDPYGGGGGGSNYPNSDPNFSTDRGRPANETGQPGVDLGSRNFNWSTPLLSLQGRAGLDLNLTLFYNSLVWTRDGSFMKFNADLGSPAPGFQLGLPKLQQRFLNSQREGALTKRALVAAAGNTATGVLITREVRAYWNLVTNIGPQYGKDLEDCEKKFGKQD